MNASERTYSGVVENPAPWWYRLASRLLPGRCREIPEAQNPRIVLRQFAIIKRYVYLQQFASSEDERYMHSHQWHRTIAIGLWGRYVERRIAGPDRARRAPYLYTMDASIVHHVQAPSRGHTSIFIGVGRDDSLKHYYGTPNTLDSAISEMGVTPLTDRRCWEDHIPPAKRVARI